MADEDAEPAWPTQPGVATVIAEIDGGMVPPVQSAPESAERRRGKRVYWKDAKLSLAHAHGSTERTYGATGGVEVAGRQLLGCAIAAGPGTDTRVQALGDGATWIADQVAERFGTPGRYTVDCFHVCGYLADAAGVCAPEAPKPTREQQKARSKANDSAAVPATLRPALEPPSVADAEAPVRACSRDPSNRPEQLEAKGALANGLPIGSGEIESAHRYVVQQRPQAPRRLVDFRQRRGHARLAHPPRERTMGRLPDGPLQASSGTGRVATSVWIAPRAKPDLNSDYTFL